MEKNYTPGPWRWELNEATKYITLVGGKPTFDKTVMDFKRWGMNAAIPRFNSARGTKDGDHFNIMQQATSFGSIVRGREHHSNWFKDLSHPDAQLIAAAPELLEALQSVLETGLNGGNNLRLSFIAAKNKELDGNDLERAEASELAVIKAKAAINKALGKE